MKYLAYVLVCLLAGLLAGCGGNAPTVTPLPPTIPPRPTPVPTPAAPTPDLAAAPPVGVFQGEASSHLVTARIGEYLTALGSTQAGAGKRFIIVGVIVRNGDNVDLYVNPLDFSLQLRDGTTAPLDDSTFGLKTPFAAVTLASGAKTSQGNLSFRVSDRAAPHYLIYRPSTGNPVRVDWTGPPAQ